MAAPWHSSSDSLRTFGGVATLLCAFLVIPMAPSFSLLFPVTSPDSPGTPCDSVMICPGEDLIYEVNWWIFKIGEIRVKTLQTEVDGGQKRHSVTAFIDSYQGLPFVNISAIDYSSMDSACFSLGFRSIEKKDADWIVENSRFEYHNHVMIIERARQKDATSPPYTPSVYDTLPLEKSAYLDGLSILCYARANAHRVRSMRVPTVVYGKIGSTEWYFGSERSALESDAFEQPLRVVEVEGKADFEGIFGLTGDFKGWFSDDPAAVPIRGELKVILGSITIELKRWERRGWSPPFVAK